MKASSRIFAGWAAVINPVGCCENVVGGGDAANEYACWAK